MDNIKKYPEPIVGAFIRNKKGDVLLVKSYKWRGKNWSIPGGHIELGETLEDALKREVKEEVGLDVKAVRVFTIWDAINPKDFIAKKHFLFIECECFADNKSKLKIDKDEIQEARWFPLKKASNLKLEHFTGKSIKLLKNEYTDTNLCQQ